jgi:DNA-binding XRE family transcriptional regulator
MVVLPRSEYEALIAAAGDREDAADIAMYDARKAELADDSTALLPSEVTDLILRGASRLKAVRKWRDMSQVTLSETVGIGQAYLSEIETGQKPGTPETIEALANALDVPVAWLAGR